MTTKQAEAKQQHPPVERRRFLQGLGVAAGGAAAATAGTVALAAEVNETDEEQAKGRYQETEHVKRFYALNRV